MRREFDEELAELNREMISMGSLCEQAIRMTEESLIQETKEQAAKVTPLESQILEKEKHIENMCLRLLLLQQPMAADLRDISAALKMVTDMFRIGEVAKDAADIITYMQHFHRMADIEEISEKAVYMVHRSVDAFVSRDLELAKSVIAYDDVVDDLFTQVRNDLILVIRNDAENAEDYVDLLMIAKYFEKIGDHAVSIAEWTVYSLTGVHKGEAEP